VNYDNPIVIQQALNMSDSKMVPIPGPVLCVVIPTFNERANVAEVIERLRHVLNGVAWEAIFVDDNSPDGTANEVEKIGRLDARIRVIRRIGRRGLSSAVIEGMLASTAPILAVMDADLQHDEALLPAMFQKIQQGDCDIVVASRMIEGGDSEGLSPNRQRISSAASGLARRVLHSEVKDLMSGFFTLRRELVLETASRLSGIGFKILADILGSSRRPLKVIEMPYQFRQRLSGESKLDAQAASGFILLLLDKTVGQWLPARLLAYLAVGASGVLIHFAVLWVFYILDGITFEYAQTIATFAAITSNYALNNAFTYRDLRLKGLQWFRGWISFSLISAIGAVGNVGVASVLFSHDINWKLSAIAGILIGVMWNFSMSRAYTWRTVR
jgi:dolichol-phosphate mannosyltransferase